MDLEVFAQGDEDGGGDFVRFDGGAGLARGGGRDGVGLGDAREEECACDGQVEGVVRGFVDDDQAVSAGRGGGKCVLIMLLDRWDLREK